MFTSLYLVPFVIIYCNLCIFVFSIKLVLFCGAVHKRKCFFFHFEHHLCVCLFCQFVDKFGIVFLLFVVRFICKLLLVYYFVCLFVSQKLFDHAKQFNDSASEIIIIRLTFIYFCCRIILVNELLNVMNSKSTFRIIARRFQIHCRTMTGNQ